MTNDISNQIEALQLEEVDFRVQTKVFKADRLKTLSLKQCLLKEDQLCEMSSNDIRSIALEN
jgi:hypothetical protein